MRKDTIMECLARYTDRYLALYSMETYQDISNMLYCSELKLKC